MNIQFFKDNFVPLLCMPKEVVPARKGTPAFRALKGSLAGHMIAGTARTRTIGRSDSVPSVSALKHPSRLRSDGVKSQNPKLEENRGQTIYSSERRGSPLWLPSGSRFNVTNLKSRFVISPFGRDDMQ